MEKEYMFAISSQMGLNFFYFISTILLSLFFAIALTKLTLSIIYATGNANDDLLMELMRTQGITTWKELEQTSGVKSGAIWMLRDGNVDHLRWNELNQIAAALSLPLPILLSKLGLLEDNPELEASRQECLRLKQELEQLKIRN
ncbi:MAG: hypothetical protein AAF378_02840 [Cyanobacteria bacterium P01_A01_bin.84]